MGCNVSLKNGPLPNIIKLSLDGEIKNMRSRRITALLLALSMFALTGCRSFTEKAEERIVQIPDEFYAALAVGDETAIVALSPEYNPDDDLGSIRDNYPVNYEIMRRAVSYTEVEFDGDIIINRDENYAKADVTVTYIDLMEFAFDRPVSYMTYDEMIDYLESYDDFEEKDFSLRFDYDEEAEQWYLSETSARKLMRLFTDDAPEIPRCVDRTPEEATELFMDNLIMISEGDFDDLSMDFVLDDCRVYDNILERGESEEINDAVRGFVQAYMYYVINHGTYVNCDELYYPELTGSAPSSSELYAVLTSDDFLTEYYKNYLRNANLGMSDDDMWEAQTLLIYDVLTEAIPNCSPEPYSLNANVSPFADSEYDVILFSNIIADSDRGIFEAEHSVGWEQFERCHLRAFDELLEDGEISERRYDALIDALTPENTGFTVDDSVSSSGHPNQAVGTYEQVPSFSTDGSLVYGYSYPDENGYWMHYSKEPGVLDTVAYYIDDQGIWITCYFDCEFNAGTTLIADWWVDGEQVVDTDVISIDEDNVTEIEVYLPVNPDDGTYEMRLWQENHTYVIAYVTITR